MTGRLGRSGERRRETIGRQGKEMKQDSKSRRRGITRPARTGRLSSTRRLPGASWACCVDAVEAGIRRFNEAHPLASDCQVAFFEVASDETLHVNVTHRQLTKPISGWAGPGRTSDGFVHNRTFAAPTAQILRHVRDMVFADRA